MKQFFFKNCQKLRLFNVGKEHIRKNEKYKQGDIIDREVVQGSNMSSWKKG